MKMGYFCRDGGFIYLDGLIKAQMIVFEEL